MLILELKFVREHKMPTITLKYENVLFDFSLAPNTVGIVPNFNGLRSLKFSLIKVKMKSLTRF